MTEMTKKEIWKDLRKQVKVARSERDTQQATITKCEWNDPEKSCITVFQVQSVGVPNENLSDCNFSLRYIYTLCILLRRSNLKGQG